MSILSEELCREATVNGEFSTKLLKIYTSLSNEDLTILADYIDRTHLTSLDLSLEVTFENTQGLTALSRAIANQRELHEFKFEVTRNDAHLIPSDNLFLSIFNYFANRTVRKQNSLVYEATERMIRNKPFLEKLSIDLKEIDNPASKAQSLRLANNIRNAPLTHLSLNVKVERDASLPILSNHSINNRLIEVQLDGLTYGRTILHSLQHAQALRVLTINDMQLTRNDFKPLKKILKNNNQLQMVQISSTNIGQIDSPDFLNALLLCPSITYLNLVENNLNRANIGALCDYVSHNPTNLIELNLTGNAYMADDFKQLALALPFNTKIEKLVLDYNYVEDEGIQALIGLLKINHTITSVSMSHNFRYTPSNRTIAELCALLKSKDCCINELHFEQNTTIDQLKMLTEAIKLNTSLVNVTLNYNSNNILASFYKLQIIDHLNGHTPLTLPTLTPTQTFGSSAILDKESRNSSIVNFEDTFFSDEETDSDNSLNNNGLYLVLQKATSSRLSS